METTFYTNGSVYVTNARLIIGSSTYAMPNITSVRTDFIPAVSRAFLIFLGLIAAFFLWFGFALGSMGGLPILVGLAFWAIIILLLMFAKPTYALTVATSAREVQALKSKNPEVINGIVAAINEAIVRRYDGMTRPY